MIVSCEKCKTQYRLDDTVILQTEFRARCSKCGHVFMLRKPAAQQEVLSPARPRVDVLAERRDKTFETSSCKIITICNQKGGVAKTTTCLNLGTSLKQMNKRVLLVDFDIQANLSLLLGYKDEKSFFDVIHSDNGDLSQYILETEHAVCLLPSNSKMALLSKKHLADENFEYMLRDKLRAVKQHFDYILIDTPPSGDFYTLNALLASDIAMIPAQCEYLSMNGVIHIKGMLDVIQEKTNHEIDYRVLVTMFDAQNTASKVILDKVNDQHAGKIFKTIIEKDEKIQESQIVHTPVLLYCKDSRAGQQYLNLAEEVATLPSSLPDNACKEACS